MTPQVNFLTHKYRSLSSDLQYPCTTWAWLGVPVRPALGSRREQSHDSLATHVADWVLTEGNSSSVRDLVSKAKHR